MKIVCKNQSNFLVKIPKSLENAIELSKQNNHDVKIAQIRT
jgi:hypothetical protein